MSWRTPPQPVDEGQIISTNETDVMVVGLGYAGAAALRAAAEAGAEVIGIEKMREESFVSFGRDIGHINSAFLRSRGVPRVDELELYNEWMHRALNRANPALIMKFVKNSGDAFDWFTDMYGVEGLDEVHVAFWPDAARNFDGALGGWRAWRGTAQFPEIRGWSGHPTLTEVCRAHHQKAVAAGAKALFAMEAEQLISEGGRVRGLIARARDGSCHRFMARRGVILAAGDCSGNTEMTRELCPGISDMLMEGEPLPKGLGRDGRGLQMGVWAGGRLEPGSLPTMGGDYNTPFGVNGFTGMLWLDPRGRRYCDEAFGDPVIVGQAANQMPRGIYYSLFDGNIMNNLQWAFPAKGSFDEADAVQLRVLKDALEGAKRVGQGGFTGIGKTMIVKGDKKIIYAGDTMDELLDNASVTGELRQSILGSVERYNKLCAAGRDEDFGKDPKVLIPLDTPPFYMQLHEYGTPGFMLCTVGGLLTDDEQNVLDMDYRPIKGLYATGNCCGRRFGYHYSTPISGISIGIAITLGREAGRTAAGQVS